MQEQLMDIVIDTILFFSSCDDDVVDPDTAVNKLESIAASLQKLDAAERVLFCKYVELRAEREERAGLEAPLLEQLRMIPEHLGL